MMRAILNTMGAAYVAIALTACALLAPMGADDEARYAAKIGLSAYETTQQAIMIYGRLPTCDPEAGFTRLCKGREIWLKIKAAEKAASLAIAKATPVLNGTEVDAGQLAEAWLAVDEVRTAVKEAQLQLKGPHP